MFAPQACDPKTGRKNRSPFWAIVAPALFIPLPQKNQLGSEIERLFSFSFPLPFLRKFLVVKSRIRITRSLIEILRPAHVDVERHLPSKPFIHWMAITSIRSLQRTARPRPLSAALGAS
jgi:hypothetical protein